MNREWVDTVAEVLYNRQLMPDETPWHLNSDLDREEPREDAAAVLSAVLPLIADALVKNGPVLNYELNYDGTEDPLRAAYVEGHRDALNIIREFL